MIVINLEGPTLYLVSTLLRDLLTWISDSSEKQFDIMLKGLPHIRLVKK